MTASDVKLNEILREDDIEYPIEHDTDFFLNAWQLAQVDEAPQGPGDDSGKIESNNSRDTRAPSDGSQLAKRPEPERLYIGPLQRCQNIARGDFCFTEGMLPRRWMRAASQGIGNHGAIA